MAIQQSEFRVAHTDYDGWRILTGIFFALALGFAFGFLVAMSYSCVWAFGH